MPLPAETLNPATRKHAERLETTCGYAKGVDGVNTRTGLGGPDRCMVRRVSG
jgi:hypothetical protein